MFDYNEKFDWFEDDTLAKDWFNDMCGHIAWKAFENQEEWIWMAGELGNGCNPMIKPEAIEIFDRFVQEEICWMKSHIIMSFMKLYHEDDIDYSEDIKEAVEEYFGKEEEEELC